MEPAEIARRYQHHDAMLHAVREGLVITDAGGGIVLANDEARRLLELGDDCEGRPLRDHVPGAEWTATETPVTDRLQFTAGKVLMVSRSRAEVDGVPAGMVTTLRDRTELENALHELSEARVLDAELRMQAHEHANRLQTVIVLISEGNYDEAMELCAKYSELPQALSGQVLDQIADPVLASRVQVLYARAARHGVELQLNGALDLAWRALGDDLADIVGNLADNAVDAASDRGPGGWVRLDLERDADESLRISVRDNGRGITADPAEQVFAPRWTTKGGGHGFGLALARHKVAALHGEMTVRNDGGAVFEVRIPAPGTENRSDGHV
jgi:two-component system CitB family sensor kinase